MSRNQRQRAPAGTVLHKALPECPITEPHDPGVCGAVEARRHRQAEMTAGRGAPNPMSPDEQG